MSTETEFNVQEWVAVSPDDLSYDLAYRAHYNTSHEPERRAKQAQQGYVVDMVKVAQTFAPLAETPEQVELLKAELATYKANYLQKCGALLSAQSRTVSAFIVGPANFPTRRNAKRLATEDRRRDEFLKWNNNAYAAIRRKLEAARTVDQRIEVEWKRLRNHIIGDLNTIKSIDEDGAYWTRSAFVNSTVGKVERLANHGEVELVTRALALVKEYNDTHKKPAIAARNKFWTFVELAEQHAAKVEEAANADESVLAEGEGFKLVADPSIDRLQIFFDGKPDSALRDTLKRSGWRWAPSQGAWQRQLTENAKYSAKQILGLLK